MFLALTPCLIKFPAKSPTIGTRPKAPAPPNKPIAHQLGSFLGAYLGGVFYEMNGNFDYAWYGSIALSIFAGLIHLPINEKPIERLQTV